MSIFFTYKNTPIYYTIQGRGSAIILLHGFLENHTMWNAIAPELSKRNKVICIDLLGHGKSGNLGYIHTMEDQAQMIKAVLNSLNLRKYILIGHSMGGYIALAFAELYKQNIKGLCLMNSTAFADNKEKRTNRDRAIKAVKQNYKTFIRIAIPNLFSEENRKIFTLEIQQITQEALQTSAQSIVASLEGMKIRKDNTSLLKNNPFPIGLILGKKDPVLDFNTHSKLTKNTNTKLIELPDGHMSHVENKDQLRNALQNFIQFTLR